MSDHHRARLQDRFRGAMVGAVVGNCLGFQLQSKKDDNSLSYSHVRLQFNKLKENKKRDNNKWPYTADTAMSRQLTASLLSSFCRRSEERFDAKDMAERFVEGYFREPQRCYGEGVVEILKKLKGSKCSRPFLPAKEQFNGTGSYGNGGAMRVHPTALFCHGKDLDSLVELATDTAKITHSHREGYRGAMLQACAVRLALEDADDGIFVSSLKDVMADEEDEFAKALSMVERCLANDDNRMARKMLGNDASALRSVPSAVYSFLRARSGPVIGLDDDEGNKFVRTLMLACSFGGDADTIASMSGAIAGAFYGYDSIPEVLRVRCEGAGEAMWQADEILEIVYTRGEEEVEERKPRFG